MVTGKKKLDEILKPLVGKMAVYTELESVGNSTMISKTEGKIEENYFGGYVVHQERNFLESKEEKKTKINYGNKFAKLLVEGKNVPLL